MADPYIIPRRLDDPELIGFWTLDEFLAMTILNRAGFAGGRWM